MSVKTDAICRRDFLKLGGAGVASLISASEWPDWLAGATPAGREKPEKPVVLRSPQLEVVLDRGEGLPYEYRLSRAQARIRGEDFGEKIAVKLCRRAAWASTTVPITASSAKATRTQADFHFQAIYDGKPAASFVVRYVVKGATVYITLENVEEHEGYELIEVQMPRLATVREEDGSAWLAHGDDGGNLAILTEATPGHLHPNTFWGKVLASMPVVMIGTDRAICVQEVTAYMDGTELTVAGESGQRRAALGTMKTHRVDGSLCYDMNTGPGTPRVCGNDRTPNLLVEQKSSCRLDFITASDGSGSLDWLDAAKLVRKRMPEIPNRYYENRFIYSILCDLPQSEKAVTPFEQAEEHIRQIAALTDHFPQMVYLWGWQYQGKDTGYPAVAEVNRRDGGYDALMKLMNRGPDYNCLVTFSDNFDDAYKSSPEWNPDMIARRPDLELWKSRNWTGEDSYIIGLAKYMKGPGPERIRYTCERYRLREVTHIDVLSYFPVRNDWDPKHPASGIKNLEARYKIIELFGKHGVDVSSEFLRYAFLGKISSFHNAPAGGKCPFGGKPIPLLPAIYRRSAVWGQSGRAVDDLDRILKMLFYNGRPNLSLRGDFHADQITDYFYLLLLPWFKIHGRNIESFKREGERTLMGLEGDATVDINWSHRTYSVKVNGVEMARNGSTFCQLDDERLVFYSATREQLSVPLPKAWAAAKIAAVALAAGKPEAHPAEIEDGAVRVSVPARRAVMVYRDGAKARHRLLESSSSNSPDVSSSQPRGHEPVDR